MNTRNTFIATAVIKLYDDLKKLGTSLEARPKLPHTGSAGMEEAAEMLSRFSDLQVRLGAVIEVYEAELDRFIEQL